MQTLSLQEQVEQSEKNIEDHENFVHRHRACVDWLEKSQRQLDTCSTVVGDEESLNVKLAIVKVNIQNFKNLF